MIKREQYMILKKKSEQCMGLQLMTTSVCVYIYIYIVQPFFKQLHLKERVNHKLLIVINNIILHYLLKKKKKRSHTSSILLMFDDLDGNLQAIIMRRNAI